MTRAFLLFLGLTLSGCVAQHATVGLGDRKAAPPAIAALLDRYVIDHLRVGGKWNGPYTSEEVERLLPIGLREGRAWKQFASDKRDPGFYILSDLGLRNFFDDRTHMNVHGLDLIPRLVAFASSDVNAVWLNLQEPNQPSEPTRLPVTPAADAPVAPSNRVAHL